MGIGYIGTANNQATIDFCDLPEVNLDTPR